jgi:hypothetical protein
VHYNENEEDGSFQYRSAILISDSPRRRDEISAVARICNCAVLDGAIGYGMAHTTHGTDLVLIDLPSITEAYNETLSDVARYLWSHRTNALIWTNMELLEEAYALLPHDQCHYLVDASDFDAIPYLTGAIARGKMDQLHDNSRDGEFGSLHRISDELAAFAQTLARIAEQDDAYKNNSVSDKPISFRPAPPAAFHPFAMSEPAAKSEPSAVVDAAMIREIIKLRRMRDNHFKADLFADPAWDILLDLMAAKMEGKNVSVSSLCIAAAVPPTTALRWVTGMTENGMLVRRLDPTDARRVFIELSQDVADRLTTFFTSIKSRTGALI